MSKNANQQPVAINARRHAGTARPLPPNDPQASWKPQPCHLSREELRRIVLEIMG